MKTSNAVLLTIFIVLAAVIILAVVGFRIGFARLGFDAGTGEHTRRIEKPGDLATTDFPLDGFDSLRIRGPWTVNLVHGDEYSVRARDRKSVV